MRQLKAIAMFTVLTAGAAMAPAFAADATVGGFYTRLAQVKKLDAAAPAAAEASLRGAGYALPALGLDKALTEGDVAAIASAVGVKVTTTRPGSVVDQSQLDAFFTSVSAQLATGSKGPITNPYQINSHDDSGNSNGHGKKKGHNKSPSEPS